MKTCPYCGSGVEAEEGKYYCGFCDMKGMLPTEDGERRSRYQVKQLLSMEDLNKSTPELMTYHTADILQLLKIAREERRAFFKQVSVFKKAGQETDQFRDLEKQTGDEYEGLTRKAFVLENILKDRIGYIPERVTDQLLATVYNRVEQERNLKPMIIKKKEQEMSRER